MSTLRSLFAALAVALLAVPGAALAQQGAAEENPVIARLNGEEVRQSEVMEMVAGLPPEYQSQFAQLYPLFVQRLIDFKLAGRAGRDAGLADNEEVKARLAKIEDRVIRDVYLERQIDSRVTDESLRARYQRFLEENPPKTEHKARHILLKTEEEATAVIAKLDGGADFEELAKAESTGPSAAQGGDLGYFQADQMVPEFAEAAAAMEPGEYSKTPTQTQFGWHVIKVEDRRETPQPGFEEVEAQLREELSRDAVQVLFEELRAGAEIEMLPAADIVPGSATQAQ
jgi:peptidyl-prolyl cis-trans isomerase C